MIAITPTMPAAKPAPILASALSLVLFTLVFFTGITQASTVYKSIDKNGKVTYSESPIPDNEDVSKIKIAPPPTEERVESARQRHENIKKTAGIIDETRKQQDERAEKEYRIRQERQQQLQQQKQAEEANRNDQYSYPYFRRGSGIIINPGRPVARPPIQLPARPVPGPAGR